MLVQTEVVWGVMDVIEVVADKKVHKVGSEVTRNVTKEVRDMVGVHCRRVNWAQAFLTRSFKHPA